MALQMLDKKRWRPFFDRMSRALTGKVAHIDVVSLDLGAQVEANWLPLLGIVYDPKDDLVEIALDGVDHMVRSPREIYFDVVPAGLISLAIVDKEGTRQLVQLRDPLMLPPPPSNERED